MFVNRGLLWCKIVPV